DATSSGRFSFRPPFTHRPHRRPPRARAAHLKVDARTADRTCVGPVRGIRMLAPLRLRDFRLLWTGMTVSLLGDGVFLVAIAWQVLALSNLPSALAVVGLSMSLPQVLFLLLGGVVSDRVERRKVMLWADIVRGLAILAIGGLS